MRTISLNEGERLILQSQGALHFRNIWRLGHLYLTDKRLFFIHVTQKKLEIGLDNITGISIIKDLWLMGTRVKQLCIDFVDEKVEMQACIALYRPEKWVDSIKTNMLLALAERRGCDGADPESPNNA